MPPGIRDNANFVNDYLADFNDDDDPFRSPSPEPPKKTGNNEKEKKKDVLGIETQLDLKRKPRAPRVKLDESRLLSDKGIPKLRKMAPKLKFKGKGHEFSDAARLLSFYQEWLDELFPKATFLDALAMVEKTGHKTVMRNARLQWIDEGKPKAAAAEDDEDVDYAIFQGPSAPRQQQPDKAAPVVEKAAQAARERAKTPVAAAADDDLFGDDDIYNATPRRNAGSSMAAPRQVVRDAVPDEDDLDALMAEAEAQQSGSRTQQTASGPGSATFRSLFGNGAGGTASVPSAEPDDDELDALMAEAEAEAQAGSTRQSQPVVGGNTSENGASKQQTVQGVGDDDEDDLDALMAEAEAAAGPPTHNTGSSAQAETGQPSVSFDDDEEAMAELDGLW
ncbi:replication fork protection component Swi3-domain-containing protein [Chaetomium strumarium]|uniref:Chromosome segregation in meiosis protein n=1 Tax=Chaetomium strumarium TaxID=1170767 RepID=A0AAJ0M7A8_9PEZI|nr:replication fork protection component Swi3-domain-containing protein [Chaetomium strumarium]